METMNKIIKAIKNGTIFSKGLHFIHNRMPFYFVRSESTRARCNQDATYRKFEKKYRKIINSNVNGNFLVSDESPHRVWVCWLQGYESAPPLVKACINSLKRNLPDWKVTILTDKNISDYVQFPDYITKKYKKGIIPFAHYSDLLRTELLCKYGGLWCDATVLCTSKNGKPEYFTDTDFFVFKLMDLSRDKKAPIVASNWLIYSAKPNNKILMKTRELLHLYWKKENGLKDYFLFHIFFTMATRKYEEDWKKVPVFNNHSPHVLQFEFANEFSEKRWNQICVMSDFHKLNHHIDYRANSNYTGGGGIINTFWRNSAVNREGAYVD